VLMECDGLRIISISLDTHSVVLFIVFLILVRSGRESARREAVAGWVLKQEDFEKGDVDVESPEMESEFEIDDNKDTIDEDEDPEVRDADIVGEVNSLRLTKGFRL